MEISLAFLLILSFYSCTGAKIQFHNFKVYSVHVETNDQYEQLQNLHNESPSEYHLWNDIKVGQYADIMVPPHKLEQFERSISSFNSTIKIDNVQELIDNEDIKAKQQRADFGWTKYNTYSEIYAWLDSLLQTYPNILTNYEIGKSYEGRSIRAVKLSHKIGNPVIFIESNIHAREWIGAATATWILNELLTSIDPAVRDIAQNFDWIIVPILNVDGYVYTHEKNRMWRKTRQPHSLFCNGTDANRNFNFNWKGGEGASNNPCRENYGGPHLESEPEVVALKNFLKSLLTTIKLYLAFHSYGQGILLPYGHTFVPPPNYYDLMLVGLKAAAAIKRRAQRDYVVGSIAEVLYPAPGSSVDWAYGVLNVPLAFGIEFRDQPNGSYGFLLPAIEIIPNCLEAFDGIKAMITEARILKYL